MIYERYIFNPVSKNQQTIIDSYVTKLQHLDSTCKYGTLEDKLIRDTIVTGIRSKDVQGRLLRDTKLILSGAIEMCRSDEATTTQLKSIGGSVEGTVHYSTQKSKKKRLNCWPYGITIWLSSTTMSKADRSTRNGSSASGGILRQARPQA